MAKTDIAFLSGFDAPLPPEAKEAGFTHRFAVIQETYRPDSVDMFFDVPLYLAVLRFSEQFEPNTAVSVRVWDQDHSKHQEIGLADYLQSRAPKMSEDGPADFALVRSGTKLRMWVATEFYNRVGGPRPYDDSYTYAIYTLEDVGDRLRQFLTASEGSDGWNLAGEVIIREAVPPLSFWQRLFGMRRHA